MAVSHSKRDGSFLARFRALLASDSEYSNRKHIVDTLIEERAVKLRQHPYLWASIRLLLDDFLGYERAVNMIDGCATLDGVAVMDYIANLLDMNIEVDGLDYIPKEGSALVTPNHPAGVADGIAVYQALKPIRKDICFVANRDAIRVAPGLADVIIPVEWRVEERDAGKTRETVRAITQAFRDDRLVVIFPSGRLAEPTIRGLKERPWQTTALNFAQKNEAPIVPMHIKGHNTVLYYLTWYIHTELKDMTLFRELLNKRGHSYQLKLGEPFYQDKEVEQTTQRLKQFVLNDLKRGITSFKNE